MTLKKTLTFAAWAFVIYFVAFQPDAAANVVRSIGGLIATIGRGFGQFFGSLVA